MASSDSDSKVQHVNRKSSDELLRKFAVMEDEDRATKLKVTKRRRSQRSTAGAESPMRRSLLAPATRNSAATRQLKVHSRAHLKARELRHKSLFGTIQKTWRKTIEGASKVFVEKHYNRHRRLMNDIL